jgi:hypothetical protein
MLYKVNGSIDLIFYVNVYFCIQICFFNLERQHAINESTSFEGELFFFKLFRFIDYIFVEPSTP